MAEINFNGNIFELSSEYQGTAKPWGDYEKHHHVVYVDTEDKHTWFDFYCNSGVLSDDELVEAFYFFLSDGISYDQAKDIDDFQSELGYTKVSECLDAYNGCKDAYNKWTSLCDIDIYDLSNWLQETYDL